MNSTFHRITLVILLLLLLPFFCQASVRTIVKIHRADIVEIEGGWITRITGVIAPEVDEPYGREAFDFAKKTLLGVKAAMFTWTTNNRASGIVRDKDNRPFAEFQYGPAYSIDYTSELLKRGYARVDKDYLPEEKRDLYLKLEQAAREQKLGIWTDIGKK